MDGVEDETRRFVLKEPPADVEAFDQLSMKTASLASLAISAVDTALRGGDEKTGIAVLRGLGFLNGTLPQPPTDDVHELRMRQRRAAYSRMREEIDVPDLI